MIFLIFLLLAGCIPHASKIPVENNAGISLHHIQSSNLTKYQVESRKASVQVITNTGAGSGTYFKNNRKTGVITAAHVVKGSSEIFVRVESKFVSAKILYIDDKKDIAVLSADLENIAVPLELRAIRENNKSLIGLDTFYSGYPVNHSLLTISGRVAGIERGYLILQSYGWPGASGSLIFDAHGNAVGILVAIDGFGPEENFQLVETIVWVVRLSAGDIAKILSII